VARAGQRLVEQLVLSFVLFAQSDEGLEQAIEGGLSQVGAVRFGRRCQEAVQVAKVVVHGACPWELSEAADGVSVDGSCHGSMGGARNSSSSRATAGNSHGTSGVGMARRTSSMSGTGMWGV